MIPEIQIPSIVMTILQVILAFGGAFLLALWISLIIWTFRDARLRSNDVFAIVLATLMVVIFGPLGLVLYFLLRPPVTLAELYERSLEEEALLQDIEERPRCPGCSRLILDNWLICPDCHMKLKKQCVNCTQILDLNWNLCPYCASPADTLVSDVQTAQTPYLPSANDVQVHVLPENSVPHAHASYLPAASPEEAEPTVKAETPRPSVVESDELEPTIISVEPPNHAHNGSALPQETIPTRAVVSQPRPFDSDVTQIQPPTRPPETIKSPSADETRPQPPQPQAM